MTSGANDVDEYVPGDSESLRDARGVLITEAYVEQAAREAEEGFDVTNARRIGRPSLSGGARHSPRVSFRVPEDVRSRAEDVARREGKTVSQLAREALERYLAS